MVWVVIMGVAFLVAACGDAAVGDEEDAEMGWTPEEGAVMRAPLQAVPVCPDREDESCLDFSATKDDRYFVRNITRYNEFTKTAERRLDLFDRKTNAFLHQGEERIDSLFHRVQLLQDEGFLAMCYYADGPLLHRVLPDVQREAFAGVAFQGLAVSPNGGWATIEREGEDEAVVVDLQEGRDVRSLGAGRNVEGVANDGTILISSLTLVDREAWRFDQNYRITTPFTERELSLALGRRAGCGNTEGLSDDGGTVVLASLCEPLLVAHRTNEAYELREVAVPFAGRDLIGYRDMSENGRTICFDAPGDYYLYDRVADAWYPIRKRFPLALHPEHNLTVACEVASRDGVHGALYFADSNGGLFSVFRADLSQIIQE